MCIGQSLHNVQDDLPDGGGVDLSTRVAVRLDVLIQITVAEFCLYVDFDAWPLIGPSVLDLSDVGMI